MRFHIKGLSLLLSLGLLLSGCTAAPTQTTFNPTDTTQETGDEMFTDLDMEVGYDESTAVLITLNGTTAQCESSAVSMEENRVTITEAGTYLLQGTLSDGAVVVDAGDQNSVRLVLNGVDITCATSAPLYLLNADHVYITTAPDSANTLSNGGSYVAVDENNIDGVLFSKVDVTLNGSGTLTIWGEQEGHGIVSKDDLIITGGTYAITTAGHGLQGKDRVAIAGGTFTLTTGKDGIQSSNEEDADKGYVYLAGGDFSITAQGDGVSAVTWLTVEGGSYTVTTGGGAANGADHTQDTTQPGGGAFQPGGSGQQPPEGMEPPGGQNMPEGMTPPQGYGTELSQTVTLDTQEDEESTTSTKGFKAGTTLTVNGGDFILDCADDAFHSNGDMSYAGGSAQIATGDDAFHADSALTMAGGSIDITQCYEGLEGLTVTISGGEISLVASDDGVNAAGDTGDMYISITGGTLTIDAGGDGLDSNGDLTITGGTVLVSSVATGADAPLDYDGTATITGGVLLGVGAEGMAQNFGPDSTQGSILLSVGAQVAGTTLTVTDQDGEILVTWDPPKEYSCIVVSAPQLTQGSTCTVTAGDQQTQVTLDTLIYGGSSTPAGGNFGGRGPGM